MNRSRLLKLEKEQREQNREWIPPKVVSADADSFTTKEGERLVKDGERFLFEDGSIYFEPREDDGLVQLITISYV